jgi:hypothetical protein
MTTARATELLNTPKFRTAAKSILFDFKSMDRLRGRFAYANSSDEGYVAAFTIMEKNVDRAVATEAKHWGIGYNDMIALVNELS